MNIFKHQHPSDLISRLFMMEYMREIGAEDLYKKANKHQKEKMFYVYTTEVEDEKYVDINYEYCIFIANLHELEKLLKMFLEEIDEIEAKRSEIYKAFREQKIEEEIAKPVDINVMDLAQTEIQKNNGIIL